MPVVQNIVKDTTGAVVNGTTTIELVIFDSLNNPQSFQGFVDIPNDNTSDFTINLPANATIVNGFWSATLRGNTDIKDAYGVAVPTYYKITELANTVTRIYYIQVPVTAGTYWTGNIGAFNPSTYSASLALGSLADVDIAGKLNNHVLTYNISSGKWEPKYTSHANLSGLSADDHTQYLNNTRGDARYDGIGAASSSITAHIATSDPHNQYLTNSRGDLRYDAFNAASSAVSSHASASDPHSTYLNNTRGDARYQPLATSGTWTPTIGGGGTQTGTWITSWEKIGTTSYQVSISLLVTGTWSGASTLTVSLPTSWTRHATQTQFCTGQVTTSGATPSYLAVNGFIEPISVSNTAPVMKFISPNTVTTSYDWKLMTGVGQPIGFVNGYRMDVSGVIRTG